MRAWHRAIVALVWGGGPEMLKALFANVERRGIPIY
jgi:hypothetical protein